MTGGGIGCHACTRATAREHLSKQYLLPHRVIAGGGKAVEKPQVDSRVEAGESRLDIIKEQYQPDIFGQPDDMLADKRRWVVMQQCVRRGKWVLVQQLLQHRRCHRVFLNRDKVELPVCRQVLPDISGEQTVNAETEAQFANGQLGLRWQ